MPSRNWLSDKIRLIILLELVTLIELCMISRTKNSKIPNILLSTKILCSHHFLLSITTSTTQYYVFSSPLKLRIMMLMLLKNVVRKCMLFFFIFFERKMYALVEI